MGDTLDIHSLLETGYFTTSRARGGPSPVTRDPSADTDDLAGQESRPLQRPVTPTSPRPDPLAEPVFEREIPRSFKEEPRLHKSHEPTPSPSPSPPRIVNVPPPTVEDEAESLAKEHGSPSVSDYPEETPQSRGDFQQDSLMEEVHEHNPERRFVVVTGQPKSESSGSEDDGQRPKKHERRRSRRPTINEPRPEIKPSSRPEPRYEPVFDDGRDHDHAQPGLSDRRSDRRKSRNELPRIDTTLRPDRPSGRARTKSAVGGSRPDFFDAGPRRQHDGMLSPEVIKHGSGRREQPYYGYASSNSPNGRPGYPRSLSNSADERYFEAKDYNRGNLSPSASKRSGSTYHGGSKDSRYISSEKSNASRSREDYTPSRSQRREESKSYARSEEPSFRGPSTGRSREPRPRREDSRSSDERSRDTRGPSRRRRESVVIQDERRSMPNLENGASNPPAARPPSRAANLPPSPPRGSVSSTAPSGDSRNSLAGIGMAAAAAGAAGVASIGADALQNRKEHTGFAGDDVPLRASENAPPDPARNNAGPSNPSADARSAAAPADENRAQATTTVTEASPTTSSQTGTQPWEPGAFVPERDGLPVEKPMGVYRRYSENVDTSGPPKLPECRFVTPVTGNQTWLTLPRSDFNICTACYASVFEDTDYRTHFKPMLYATDRPIACDFGSSPWYRIAWLLTLRNEASDLRLFYAISRTATACRNHPCPGDRKATRVWLTIIDPYTRRPIPNFAVCLQCAQTIEALLPNMAGIFVPLDPRSEPSRDICALHFTPQRKEFVMFFDALETTADKALSTNQPPNLDILSQELEKLSRSQECPHDEPVPDGYWHIMQYLPDFTVCEKCFGEVVRPRISEDNMLARNFYLKPQRVPDATCQLYSDRMRDVFRRACRRNDTTYLAEEVRKRARKEREIHSKLMKLDRKGHDSAWTAEQVKLLVEEWKEWE
ncbi:proteinrelated to ser/arg-related nuclear matrix protein [Sarocladium implicatum]|nr:proteinrelated to ser/arg-related nuclear matrix protein [Sarocladium implicatum]